MYTLSLSNLHVHKHEVLNAGGKEQVYRFTRKKEDLLEAKHLLQWSTRHLPNKYTENMARHLVVVLASN